MVLASCPTLQSVKLSSVVGVFWHQDYSVLALPGDPVSSNVNTSCYT